MPEWVFPDRNSDTPKNRTYDVRLEPGKLLNEYGAEQISVIAEMLYIQDYTNEKQREYGEAEFSLKELFGDEKPYGVLLYDPIKGHVTVHTN